MAASPTLVTVAPTGAEHSKADVPQLPVTISEIVSTAVDCEKAGAGLIHLHLRDGAHRPSLDLSIGREWVDAVRSETNLVVQVSSGGAISDSYQDRIGILDSLPDSCSITLGSLNFGEEVFMNPWPFIIRLHDRARELEIVPEYEVFDLGQLATLSRLLDTRGLPFGGKVHCNFVMGVAGGMPGDSKTLVNLVERLPDHVTSWSATGIGRAASVIGPLSVALGGNVRVGLEDTLFLGPGVRAVSNLALVEQAVSWASLHHRRPLSPSEARELLNIKPGAAEA